MVAVTLTMPGEALVTVTLQAPLSSAVEQLAAESEALPSTVKSIGAEPTGSGMPALIRSCCTVASTTDPAPVTATVGGVTVSVRTAGDAATYELKCGSAALIVC